MDPHPPNEAVDGAKPSAGASPPNHSMSPKKSGRSKKATIPIPAAKSDEEIGDVSTTRIRIGICAMDKKARSQPMAEILSRLDERQFRVIFFGDDLILNQAVENWPDCDVLVAFYSKGYPLEKARMYVDLRTPVILNDLDMQQTIRDRRKVYDLLEESGIDVPRHVYLSRDGYVSRGSGDGDGSNGPLVEHDDHIELNGVVINKPFVEKPIDADDHNINIYYPTSAGGGCKKLFRKIGNRSSEFYPGINEVRKEGSYIYEEFVETQGTDVKMYTVGPEYGHAEARKSPTVDGKVERNSEGKEVRFPVILTLREKEIARRIVLVFGQMVCGFDLLRVQEGDSLVSYVCDVNGWSFVKNSRKYYDDCAQILSEHMLARLKPELLRCFSTLDPLLTTKTSSEDLEAQGEAEGGRQARQGSMPLQRVSRMLQADEVKEGETARMRNDSGRLVDQWSASVSAATTLEEGALPVREIPDALTSEPASMCPSSSSSQAGDGEPSKARSQSVTNSHQEELRCMIAVVRHGDRTPKQKLKINTTEPKILEYFHHHAVNCRKDVKVKAKTPMLEFLETVRDMIKEKQCHATIPEEKSMLLKLLHVRDVLERWKIVGLNRKLQIKPREWEEFIDPETGETGVKCVEVQLILKWGGNLTKLGERQAINLGQRLRQEMYPEGPGGGILRLHSTFRHDLKIKTSDEGRVMKTAAAFAKGLLELEGEITPILVSLVHKEKDSLHMLDPSGNKEVKKELDECKEKINLNLQRDLEFAETTQEEHEEIVGPAQMASLHEAFQKVGNPRRTLSKIHQAIGELIEQLEDMLGLMASGDENRLDGEGLQGGEGDLALSGVKLYKGETLLELTERWRFIHDRLYDEDKDTFDLSRIPDVHDNVRFDMLHNPHLGLTSTLEKLYELAKFMADCVVPQEYGTTLGEKISIGSKMCRALLEKIKYDLIIAKTDNQVDMRYMINMEYGSDLAINTMGRRVRTRLYFSSESHLHTMLNVLRFGSTEDQTTILSPSGIALVNSTPELCYLTQIVFRLFEDTQRDMDDPKRFRVEVMFSPGATATPLHMGELDRELDSTRFDTDELQMIGREGLTCKEVENFFSDVIQAGKTGEDLCEVASMPTTTEPRKRTRSPLPRRDPRVVDNGRRLKFALADEVMVSSPEQSPKLGRPAPPDESTNSSNSMAEEASTPSSAETKQSREITVDGQELKKEPEDDDGSEAGRASRILARQFYLIAVSTLCIIAGAGCLFLSMNIRGPTARSQRRWTRRW